MIVKDESHIILHTLSKLLKKINIDYYAISDTGSSDNTIEIIQTFFKERSIPGEIHQDTWKDFGTNRSIALEYAYLKADYILIFDADDSIEGNFKLPELKLDAYMLKFGNHTTSYNRMCLVKGSIKWNYIGVLHEVITTSVPITQGNIDGDYFIISGRTSARNKNGNKYLEDAKILSEAYYECIKNNDPLYNRYVYYCANSYLDAGDNQNALKWYHKTLTCSGWFDEKYNSCLKIYELTEDPSRFYYLVKSYTYNPRRVEGILQLVKHYACEGQYTIANTYYSLIKNYYELEYLSDDLSTKLFANVMDYSFYLPYYMIIVCEKLKLYSTGIKMYNIIFEKMTFTEEWYIDNLIYNLQFYPEQNEDFYNKLIEYLLFIEKNHNYKIKKQLIDRYKLFKNILIYTGFSETRWNLTYSLSNAVGGSERAAIELYKRIPKEYSVIISGDVLEEEIDNVKFINRFNLKNVVFDTIIVSRYVSFFTLYPYFKCNKLILQAHDTCFLNNLDGCNKSPLSLVNTYKDLITNCICLTKWHADEYKKLYPCISEKITIINNGIDTTLFNYDNLKNKNSFIYSSCPERGLDRLLELWPEILNKMPDATLHICTYTKFPRNESENNMNTIINSYESITHYGKLNQTDLYNLMSKCEYWLYPVNFNETSCITSMEMLMSEVICLYYPLGGLCDTLGEYGIQISHGNEIEKIMELSEEQKIKIRKNGLCYAESCSWDNRMLKWNSVFGFNTIKIINLKKRLDRKENITLQLQKQNISNYEFFEAIDGNEIVETEELRLLFENNDFNYRKGIIGCSLSHIMLRKKLVESENNYYVILEDDITLCDNFKEIINYVTQLFLEQKLDFLVLCNIYDRNNCNNCNKLYTIEQGNKNERRHSPTFGYIISKSAAKKSLDFFNKCSIKAGFDNILILAIDIKYHYLNQNILFQTHNDTDIQNNYNSFKFESSSLHVIKVAFCDWWEHEYCGGIFDKQNNFFTKLLENVIVVEPSDNPDILFYSIFGNSHQNYNAKRKVFYSGEPFSARPNANYNITFDKESLNNSRIPLWVMYMNDYIFNNRLNGGIEVPLKNKFCSFISSGEVKTIHRKTIVSLLSEYKRVDCGGPYLNNVPIVPRGTDCSGKINFNNDYKFSIAFENEDYPGYVTEKILDIYKSNCIPIYWGTRQVIFDFNPSTFINANDFSSFEELVKFIIKVDNDQELYSSYFKETIFSGYWLNVFNDPNKIYFKNVKDLVIGKNEKLLDNYFSYNFKISESWFGNSELKQFNFEDKEYSILEIGCFEGCSSCFFSDNLKISKMVCVDPFVSDGCIPYDHNYLKNIFYNNIKKSKNCNKIEVKEMYSDDFFNTNIELFDFIYIDGEHSDKQIKNDLTNSFKCIKPGGIIWCDDYNNAWKNTFLEFINKNEVTIIHEGYQLGLIKNESKTLPIVIYGPRWTYQLIEDYVKNVNYTYITNLDQLKEPYPDKILLINNIFDKNVFDKNIEIGILNIDSLHIPNFLNELLKNVYEYPNVKLYDYSLSNINVLKKLNIQSTFLEYKFNEVEVNYLKEINKQDKIYDFGIIGYNPDLSEQTRRKYIVEKLRNNGHSVSVVCGFGKERDIELGKCKIILNIHQKSFKRECVTFEHIRCNRLLYSGFNILSEASYGIDDDFCFKYPNLKFIKYNDFENITKENIENNNVVEINKHVCIYNIWHNKLFDHCYKDLDSYSLNQITMFDVNESYEKIYSSDKNYKIIREYNLPYYNSLYQNTNYCQASAFYHIFKNNLYFDNDYIGFIQYDMVLQENFIYDIEHKMNKTENDVYFYSLLVSNKIDMPYICEPYTNSILEKYNSYFKTNHTHHSIKEQDIYFICLHTFVIPTTTYIKMMSWYCSILEWLHNNYINGIYTESMSEVTEQIFGLFLLLQIIENKNIKLHPLKLEHEWPKLHNQVSFKNYKERFNSLK
jgi:GR25 family glycosyltransferase involved in LPS biosynthesis